MGLPGMTQSTAHEWRETAHERSIRIESLQERAANSDILLCEVRLRRRPSICRRTSQQVYFLNLLAQMPSPTLVHMTSLP